MAFYSDGVNEYFSLILDPIKREKHPKYVFALNKLQVSLARYLIPRLLIVSMSVFIAVLALVIMQNIGLSGGLLSNSTQTSLIIALTCVAGVCVYCEIAFFFWARVSQKSRHQQDHCASLVGIRLLKTRSWMTYLIFLSSMLVPFVSFAALPGRLDLSNYIAYVHTSGILNTIFVLQIVALFIALCVLLIKQIFVILMR
jgi:hypothetical protein